jgi:hypothetical protein
LVGTTLRTTAGLIDEIVNARHVEALSQQLRDISIERSILGALPLIAISVVVAWILATASTRNRDDQRFMGTLVRYALGASYLLSFLLALVPEAWSALIEVFSLFVKPPIEPLFGAAFSFLFFGGIAAIILLHGVAPVIVPALCITKGARWLVPPDRRRYARRIAIFALSIVLLGIAPGAARRVYARASKWLPDTEKAVSVVVKPGAPALVDTDRSCDRCPAVSIPVALVNEGKGPVAIGTATIQITGERVRKAITDAFPFADCEWFEYPAEFTPEVGPRADVAGRIARSGDLIAGRIQARVPRSILQASACDETVWLRGAVTAVEVASGEQSGDARETRSSWTTLKELCPETRSIAEQPSGRAVLEEQMALALTFRSAFVDSQCSFRWSILWESPDEKRHDEAMTFLFGRTILKTETK